MIRVALFIVALALAAPVHALTPTEAIFIFVAGYCEQKVDPSMTADENRYFVDKLSEMFGATRREVMDVLNTMPKPYRHSQYRNLINREGGCKAMVKNAERLSDRNLAPKPALEGKTKEDYFEF